MNLVAGRAVGVTLNRSLMLLVCDAHVAPFTIHPAAASVFVRQMRVMTEAARINIAVCGLSADDELADERRIHDRGTCWPAAVTFQATRSRD